MLYPTNPTNYNNYICTRKCGSCGSLTLVLLEPNALHNTYSYGLTIPPKPLYWPPAPSLLIKANQQVLAIYPMANNYVKIQQQVSLFIINLYLYNSHDKCMQVVMLHEY